VVDRTALSISCVKPFTDRQRRFIKKLLRNRPQGYGWTYDSQKQIVRKGKDCKS
jgi:hypothetical protein